MKKICFLLLVVLQFGVLGQTFTDINAGLPGLSSSPCSWGDYDNDGDLDILVSGLSDIGAVSKIYCNDSGVFTDINAGLIGVYNGSVDWGDYDNDGDLDLLLTGASGAHPDYNPVSKIYRNDSGTFNDIDAGLPGINAGSAVWGDYDNDGDLDILIAGSESDDTISQIYRNDSGIFSNINAGLPGIVAGSADWVDFDNDADLDLILTGWSETDISAISKVFRNDSGAFVDINAGLTGVVLSFFSWGDYDNDGDLDLFLAGDTMAEYVSEIYRNNSGVFSRTTVGLPGVAVGSSAWGDFDNDGDLDLLISGEKYVDWQYYIISEIYQNISNSFVLDENIILQVVKSGSVVWGDYDNDGGLDILLSGSDVTKIYRNNSVVSNSSPSAPSNLTAVQDENSLTFTWDKATDNETPQDGLSYNLYVGTTPSACDIMSLMSDISNGYRKVVELGNVNQNTSWTVKNLDPGTYYWSVQAIDHCFAGSPFVPEQTIIVTGIEDETIPLVTELFQNYPNPFNPETTIKYSLADGAQVKLTVYDIAGREVAGLVDQKQDRGYHEAKFNGDMLTSGLYFYKLSVNDKVVASKKMMLLK